MSNNIFKAHVAVITGAGQGIGFEIARQLAVQGAAVVLNDSDRVLAENAAKTISAEGGVCHALAGDAADVSFIRSMVQYATDHFGRITLAVANAGLSLYGNFFDYAPEDFDRVIRLNLGGSFYLAQAAAIQMKKQREGGSILFMSSVTGHQAHKDLAAYSMTKAGLEMLAKNLVVELSSFNISVNALAPGATLTERTLSFPDYTETWSAITPTGRPATVHDIAHAALFLLSPASRHITGQTLIVDGGWTSVSPTPKEK